MFRPNLNIPGHWAFTPHNCGQQLLNIWSSGMNRLFVAAGLPAVCGLLSGRRSEGVASCEGSIKAPSFGTASRHGPRSFRSPDPVTLDSMVLLSGSAHPKLAENIAREIKKPLCNATLGRFADGEVSVQINDNIRGKDVYVIQSCAAPVNDSIMELLLATSCIRRADVRRVIAVVPYFGYKHHRRGTALSTKHHSRFLSSGAADFATMLEELGVDRVIAVDLQRPGQGHEACFFDNGVPVETFLTTDLFVDHLVKNNVLQGPITVVTPNAEGFKKARNFQKGLQKHFSSVNFLPFFAADSSSGPADAKTLTTLSHDMGDVKGRDIVIVDDLIDTATTIVILSERLKQAGARNIYVCAPHGLFTECSSQTIENSTLSKVFVLDTLPLPRNLTSKVEEVSIAGELAKIILAEHFRTVSQEEEKFQNEE